jgi:hypothetical protein
VSDNRSPELRAACDALTDAITAWCKAHDALGDGEVVEHFILGVSVTGFDLASRSSTRYTYGVRDDGAGPLAASAHSVLGLAAKTLHWAKQVCHDDGNDDD